jgi:hypothetical protein
MKMLLYVIIDTSGSMNEMGKVHLLRNLCRYLSQLKAIGYEDYTDIETCYFQWAQSVSEIKFVKDGDIPAFISEGSSSLSALSDFFSHNLSETEDLRALILSDGNYPNSDISSFQKKLSSFSGLIMRTVAVGADADLLKLKKISTNNSVYLSENIASAIDCTIFGNDERMAAPETTTQILQAEPAEPEEDWDA